MSEGAALTLSVIVGGLITGWALSLMLDAIGHRRRFGEWPYRDERGGCCNTGRHRRRGGYEALAQDVQQAWWEWQQRNPGVPIMEGIVTNEGSAIRWNGPNQSAADQGTEPSA